MAHLDAVHLVGDIGVVQEDRRPGVLDDVGDLIGREPEVDRHQDAAEPADPEERGEEAARVRADDGDPLPVPDTEVVEGQGQTPCPRLELGVRLCRQRARHPRLVLHGDPVPVDECGPVEEVGHRQRDLHATPDLSYPVSSPSLTLADARPTSVALEVAEHGVRDVRLLQLGDLVL